jgi:hypothetical protein
MLPIRLKFDVGGRTDLLADRFVGFLNARHELAAARASNRADAGTVDAAALLNLQNATVIAEEDLADAGDLVARLSGVDGALVITSDLRIVGFGAEIVVAPTVPIPAFEVHGSPQNPKDWRIIDGDRFGMRHRSALRAVTVAENAAAFVVSQDRTVTFFWKQDARVLLKRHVNTGNPSVVGA